MKNKLNTIFFVPLWIVFLEFIYRIFILKNFLSWNTLTSLCFILPLAILFSIIIHLFKDKVVKVLIYIFLPLYTIYTLAQIVYFLFYGSIISFYSLTAGAGQIWEFWQAILRTILNNWYIMAIVLVPLILFYIFANKLFSFKRITKKKLLVQLIVLVICLIGSSIMIWKKDKSMYSTKNLLFYTHAPMLTIDKIGLLPMENLDLFRFITGFEERETKKEEEKLVLDEKTEYNILKDINFTALAETTDGTIKSINEYVLTTSPTEKNNYSGLFKGKNIVFITAEAFDTIALDPNLTPTLYKMANNAFVFENYYQPLYTVSTTDGEYQNLMSLVPKQGVWSFTRSSKNYQPFGFGTVFKNQNYTSFAYHNHHYQYYDRDKTHPNIGFTYQACKNGLQKRMNCNKWPNSDYEMIDVTTSDWLNNEKPFATYYMTVSGHLEYNFGGNAMASRNKAAVNNLSYSTAVKAYLATQIELDKAMNLLIQRLDEAGKLEDTLIVLACDHYPYGLTPAQLNERSSIDRSDKFEKHHSTLIMYNPSIEKQVIKDVCSGIDIIPTIYNLFGIEFDSRLYAGRDIFGNEEHIVIFSDRSWVTQKGKYNSVNGAFTKTTEEDLPEDYVNKINEIVGKRVTLSTQILDTNYYSTLGI